jgi:hypothetical protein
MKVLERKTFVAPARSVIRDIHRLIITGAVSSGDAFGFKSGGIPCGFSPRISRTSDFGLASYSKKSWSDPARVAPQPTARRVARLPVESPQDGEDGPCAKGNGEWGSFEREAKGRSVPFLHSPGEDPG